MPVTTAQIKAELTAEEPDYATLAATYGSEILPALAAIVEDRLSCPMVAAKATYLASQLKPAAGASAAVIVSAARHKNAVVKVAAAAAACHVRTADVIAKLVKMIKAGDYGIQKTALESLRRWPTPVPDELVSAVQSAAKEHTVERVRAMFTDALVWVAEVDRPPDAPPAPPLTSPIGVGAGKKHCFAQGEGDGWGSVVVALGRARGQRD
jgi:hypothetical protein